MSQQEKAVAKANLEMVQSQVLQKGCAEILCPYCGFTNFKVSRTICCDTLRKAIIAILSGERALKTAEAAEKAMQN